MYRMDKKECYVKIAYLISLRSSCLSRKVGCILTDEEGRILSLGYNGPPKGYPHCKTCLRRGFANYKSGENLDKCPAIHAEQNALLQCKNIDTIYIAYCTMSPCIHCMKLLANTSCQFLIFSTLYPGSKPALDLWEKSKGENSWSIYSEGGDK